EQTVPEKDLRCILLLSDALTFGTTQTLGSSMFDRSDFDQLSSEQLTFWAAHNHCPGIYYTAYPQSAFRTRSSEERIRVTRVRKRQGENGLNFWLFAEWIDWRPGGENYFAGYVSDAKFEEVSEAVFNQMVAEQAIDLIAPLKQPLHESTGFVGALLMYSMKTEFIVSLFAEYEDEYIHFYWDTTA
ncbi:MULTISPECIES: hypothetical protein, partial [unclassified Pseudomonas]